MGWYKHASLQDAQKSLGKSVIALSDNQRQMLPRLIPVSNNFIEMSITRMKLFLSSIRQKLLLIFKFTKTTNSKNQKKKNSQFWRSRLLNQNKTHKKPKKIVQNPPANAPGKIP